MTWQLAIGRTRSSTSTGTTAGPLQRPVQYRGNMAAEDLKPPDCQAAFGEVPIRPEYAKALDVLRMAISQQGPWIQPSEVRSMKGCPATNFMALSKVAFSASDIPSEAHWGWNQSGKMQTYPCEDMQVRMVKYMPRFKRGRGQKQAVPHYKIWIISAFKVGETVHFCWMERGQPPLSFGSCSSMAILGHSPELQLQAPSQCDASSALESSGQLRRTWPGVSHMPQEVSSTQRHSSSRVSTTCTEPPESLTLNDLSFLQEWLES